MNSPARKFYFLISHVHRLHDAYYCILSVDKETEKLMQEIARVAFEDCTVIAVAHHLDTIVAYDMIAVFADGKLIEVGEPGELREKEGSKFREMVGRA